MTTLGLVIGRGLASARPAFGIEGRLYFSTDSGILERDSGAAWQSVEGASGATDAEDVAYDPTASGLAATDVQEAIDELAGGATLLLDVAVTTDFLVAATPAGSWIDASPEWGFTQPAHEPLVEIAIGGHILGLNTGSDHNTASRFLLDGSPHALGGAAMTATQYINFFTGAVPKKFAGLAAGAHTLKVQIFAASGGSGAVSAYLRAATDVERCTAQVTAL